MAGRGAGRTGGASPPELGSEQTVAASSSGQARINSAKPPREVKAKATQHSDQPKDAAEANARQRTGDATQVQIWPDRPRGVAGGGAACGGGR